MINDLSIRLERIRYALALSSLSRAEIMCAIDSSTQHNNNNGAGVVQVVRLINLTGQYLGTVPTGANRDHHGVQSIVQITCRDVS